MDGVLLVKGVHDATESIKSSAVEAFLDQIDWLGEAKVDNVRAEGCVEDKGFPAGGVDADHRRMATDGVNGKKTDDVGWKKVDDCCEKKREKSWKHRQDLSFWSGRSIGCLNDRDRGCGSDLVVSRPKRPTEGAGKRQSRLLGR